MFDKISMSKSDVFVSITVVGLLNSPYPNSVSFAQVILFTPPNHVLIILVVTIATLVVSV